MIDPNAPVCVYDCGRLSYWASWASLASLVVSLLAWVAVANAKRSLTRELRASDTLQKLRIVRSQMKKDLSSGSPLAVSNAAAHWAKVEAHMRVLVDLLDKSQKTKLAHAKITLSDAAIDEGSVRHALKLLDGFVVEIEAIIEEWKRK